PRAAAAWHRPWDRPWRRHPPGPNVAGWSGERPSSRGGTRISALGTWERSWHKTAPLPRRRDRTKGKSCSLLALPCHFSFGPAGPSPDLPKAAQHSSIAASALSARPGLIVKLMPFDSHHVSQWASRKAAAFGSTIKLVRANEAKSPA